MKKFVLIPAIAVVLLSGILIFPLISAEGTVPPWIKNTAEYWVKGQVSDTEFLNAMKFLIENGILEVDSKQELSKPSTDSENTKLAGIAYSAYRAGQSPIHGPHPTESQIDNDLHYLSAMTKSIRIYGITDVQEKIPEIAKKYGLTVEASLFLTGNESDDTRQIEQATKFVKAHPETIDSIIVSSEVLFRNTMTEEQIIKAITELRSKISPEIKLTVAEPSHIWFEHHGLADYVDYITIHYYAYWSGISIDNAAENTIDTYYAVRDTFKKDVIIGETGWPSDGLPISDDSSKIMREQAVPSIENQKKFVDDFRKLADSQNIQYYLFEAFDESWKKDEKLGTDTLDNFAESNWGLFYENGTAKNSLNNIVIPKTTTDRN